MMWESRKPRKILNNGNIKDIQQFWRKGGGGALRLRLWRYSRYNSQQRPSRTLCPMTCAGSKNLWSENESVHLKISTWGDDSHRIRERQLELSSGSLLTYIRELWIIELGSRFPTR